MRATFKMKDTFKMRAFNFLRELQKQLKFVSCLSTAPRLENYQLFGKQEKKAI